MFGLGFRFWAMALWYELSSNNGPPPTTGVLQTDMSSTSSEWFFIL